MGKIKISLASGASSEKPLINAFLENNNSYVVLDNEINGSMGLPIILVSKLEGNKLVKIIDQSEWQLVKEYLKNIIAGNKVEFIKINNEISADDIYYTQLTLPVPSFDALKNAYPFKEEDVTSAVSPIENAMNTQAQSYPVEQEIRESITTPTLQESPINNVTPLQPEPTEQVGIMDAPINIVSPVENTNQSTVENPISIETPNIASVSPAEPVANINPSTVDINIPSSNENDSQTVSIESVSLSEPKIDQASFQNVEVSPVTPIEQVVEQQSANLDNPLLNNLNAPLAQEDTKEPEISPTPIIDTPIASASSTSIAKENIFKEQKEAFMQACENMFDALVQKFEKELENNK